MRYLKPLSMIVVTGSLTFATHTMALEAANKNISYSNVEAGYQKLTGDGSFDGFFVRGGYQFTDNIYVKGEFNNLEADAVTQEGLSVVGGFATALNSTVDVYGELGLARYEVEVDFGPWGKASNDETGLQLEAGARMLLQENIEVQGYFRHLAVDDSDDSFLGAKGVFNITPQIAAFADASYLFDAEEFLLQIGGRFNF